MLAEQIVNGLVLGSFVAVSVLALGAPLRAGALAAFVVINHLLVADWQNKVWKYGLPADQRLKME